MCTSSVLQDDEYVLALQLAASVQIGELDEERDALDPPAELLDEPDSRPCRSSSRQQIVDNQNALSRLDRILVHFQAVTAVFQLVGGAHRRRRQFAELAHRHEAGTDAIGNRRAQNEAAAFDSDDDFDLPSAIRYRQAVDRHPKPFGVPEQRGDVVEQNAGFRKVRHVTNLRFECFHICGFDAPSCADAYSPDRESGGSSVGYFFLDPHRFHARAGWPAAHCGLDAVDRLPFAFEVDLDAAIGQVPDPAVHTLDRGTLLGEEPETDALHAAADEQSSRYKYETTDY